MPNAPPVDIQALLAQWAERRLELERLYNVASFYPLAKIPSDIFRRTSIESNGKN